MIYGFNIGYHYAYPSGEKFHGCIVYLGLVFFGKLTGRLMAFVIVEFIYKYKG